MDARPNAACPEGDTSRRLRSRGSSRFARATEQRGQFPQNARPWQSRTSAVGDPTRPSRFRGSETPGCCPTKDLAVADGTGRDVTPPSRKERFGRCGPPAAARTPSRARRSGRDPTPAATGPKPRAGVPDILDLRHRAREPRSASGSWPRTELARPEGRGPSIGPPVRIPPQTTRPKPRRHGAHSTPRSRRAPTLSRRTPEGEPAASPKVPPPKKRSGPATGPDPGWRRCF